MNDFHINGTFPTIISPKKQITFLDVIKDVPNYKLQMEQLLLKNGALLFRGFPFSKPEDFAQFIEALNLGEVVSYILGDSPRDKVKNKVYTSTEVPSRLHLPLHQELSYIKRYPQHIYFFCQIAPKIQGETIIANAREVYQALNPELLKRFQEKKITYISRYHCNDPLLNTLNRFARSHKSWMEVFETTDKSEVEHICRTNEIDFAWLPNDWLEIRQTRPSELEHPETNETVWFNQAHLYDFNPRLIGLLQYLGVKLLYARPSTCLHEVTFGDGTPIPRKDLYHILDVLEQKTVAYPWQQGDVMVLDNVLTMHGRAPFKGERRILTALTINKTETV